MDSQGMSQLSANKNFAQTITFQGVDTNYTVQIVATDVTVKCSAGNHNHGSSKVKLTNVVDYNWEQKYYNGHLLAVHVSGKYFAYAIKGIEPHMCLLAQNATGKGGGMVRVATHDSRMRALIKDMTGQVQDIAFAHVYNAVILACVDEEGSLFIYNIEEKADTLLCTLVLHIIQSDTPLQNLHRVVWCPFLPEEDDTDDDVSRLLVLTHGNKAELINVAIIHGRHGKGPVPIADLTDGYLEINEHTQAIMDAAFSPDGTAVATASKDGYVKFFQIYMHDGTKPRCLHEWKPHDGKPLSFLTFLDNHSIYGAEEQFWKFAITGCNNNTELKIWSCESWTCLQTIKLDQNPVAPSHDIFLKARLDVTAGYLLLSDINNRILYILEMYKDRNGGSNAYARSISEFLLPAPFLNFAILEASLRKFRCSNSTEDLYPCEENDEFDDDQNIVATVVRMYVIQPKRLQECQIVYQSDSFKMSSNINKKILFPAELDNENDSSEKLQDISSSTTADNVVSQLTQLTNMFQTNDIQSLLMQPTQPLNLMTPDAFSSPAKNDTNDQIDSSQNSSQSPVLIKMNSPDDKLSDSAISSSANDLLNYQRVQKDNFASGGSSPSREVQEILSLNKANYNTHEYYENDAKVIETEEKQNFDENDETNYQPTTNMNLNADGWPSIPILKAKEVLKSEENRLACAADNLTGDQLNNLTEPLIAMNHHKENSTTTTDLHNLEQWIVTLISLVREQSNQLEQLQNEVKCLKKAQDKCSVPEDLENVIAKQLDLALARSHAQQTKLFDNWSNTRLNKDREHHESVAMNLSHLVTKQVHEKLQNVVNIEMKQTILPVIVGTFENLKHILQDDLTQKLVTSDQMLKEHLSKCVSSKFVADGISSAVVNVLRPSMEKCYKEVISSTLLPSWERVCNNMFQQLNDTFTQGTREYTQSLETYLEKSNRRTHDKSREVVIQMQGVCDTMRNNTEKFASSLPLELQKQFLSSFSTMQENLTTSMTDIIRDQVAVAFRNHASVLEDSVINAVRSRAVTPSPHDTQVQLAQIQQLLTQGHVNTAFQQALSASDLSLVVYICERLNPQAVFSQTPCPLQQHVLLSLIQQLSADMTNHTELKSRYLEEAVLNLDPTYPVTKEHMSTVLRELLRQLAAFISANPNHKIVRNMKMLQMAAQSLLKT